jgi:hypothetical protein
MLRVLLKLQSPTMSKRLRAYFYALEPKDGA